MTDILNPEYYKKYFENLARKEVNALTEYYRRWFEEHGTLDAKEVYGRDLNCPDSLKRSVIARLEFLGEIWYDEYRDCWVKTK